MAVLRKNGPELARWEVETPPAHDGLLPRRTIYSARANGWVLSRALFDDGTGKYDSFGWKRAFSVRRKKDGKLLKGESLFTAIARRIWMTRTTAKFFSDQSRIKDFKLLFAVPEVIRAIRDYNEGAAKEEFRWEPEGYDAEGWKI